MGPISIRRDSRYAVELDVVRHVAHIPHARRIVEDGRIKAGLVYDESKLNTTRLSVAWVSANTWAWGSLYGTVEFQFSWADLIERFPRIYWVEEMPDYRPPAYRFLLSDSKQPSSLMERYDPERDEGPLRTWGGKWYWNCEYTSEFMITEDLPLRRSTGLAFVQHSRDYCRLDGSGSSIDASNRHRRRRWTHARVRSRPRTPYARSTLQQERTIQSTCPVLRRSEPLANGGDHFGGTLKRDGSCDTIVRGALALYGMDQVEQARSCSG